MNIDNIDIDKLVEGKFDEDILDNPGMTLVDMVINEEKDAEKDIFLGENSDMRFVDIIEAADPEVLELEQ